jgi:small subunit ribosomal protein S2
VAKELAKKLINAGAHFGHGASRWNPKMKPYIYSKRGKIHVIDIKETLKGIILAKKLIVDVVSSGRDVIFVGTKRQAQTAVAKHAQSCSMHFVSQRWLGGMLTNFRTIRSRLQRLEELEAMAASGTLEKESKKQASRLKREMRKIKGNLDGVRKMPQMPGVVVAIDAKKEYIALREARKLGIPTIAILDTDSDPDTVDIAIPANDDSIRAVDIILGELAAAVAVAKTMAPSPGAKTSRPRRARSSRSAIARADDKSADAAPVAAAVAAEESSPVQPAQAPSEQPAPAEDKPQQ